MDFVDFAKEKQHFSRKINEFLCFFAQNQQNPLILRKNQHFQITTIMKVTLQYVLVN